MSVRPVLFEDHTWARFRPLAWSVPLPEVRCGVFSLRERVALLTGGGGDLAVRPLLRPLAADPVWRAGDGPDAGPALWLSGRLAPDFTALGTLVAAAGRGSFALRDEGGLLACAADAGLATALADSWRAWLGRALPERVDGAPEPWRPSLPDSWGAVDLEEGLTWLSPAAGGAAAPTGGLAPALGWIWDVVPRTAAALAADLAYVTDRGWRRHPWGLAAAPGTEPVWARETALGRGEETAARAGAVVLGEGGLWLGPGADLTPGAVVDTRPGPVILDAGVAVGAHVSLEGPLYLGPGTRVKAGARLYGETSCGVGCRLAGEIGESTFGDFANKQHDGFIGHAVLGSWVNLGAMTTCSDLKNNYGPVRADLGFGSVDTGLRFVGLLMGDHAKTAIGTLFNTGTCVGFAANVFGGGMPPKHVAGFSWGGGPDAPRYDPDRAAATAAVVLGRRGCVFGAAHETLFRALGSL